MRGTSRYPPGSSLYETSLTRSTPTSPQLRVDCSHWHTMASASTGTLAWYSPWWARLAGEFRRGDLRGNPHEELDGVAGRLVPRAGDPLAEDPCAGDCRVFMPNILAALSKSESESRKGGQYVWHKHPMRTILWWSECGVLPEDKLQRLLVGVSTFTFLQTHLQTRVRCFSEAGL